MKTKTIPFDLETAKKIQAGEIKGKIKTRDFGYECTIVEYYVYTGYTGIDNLLLVKFPAHDFEKEKLKVYHCDGRYMSKQYGENWFDLVLEVPDGPQFNSSYSIEQLNKLKEYTKQLMEVNQGVIDDLSCMIQELKKTCNSSSKTEFKPFDKVLVRDSPAWEWKIDFFSAYHPEKELGSYVCTGGEYEYCIPYEGNEHLVGTTNKPKEG